MKALNPPTYQKGFIELLVDIRNAKKVDAAGVDHAALLVSKHHVILNRYKAFEKAYQNHALETLIASAELKSIAASLTSCYGRTAGCEKVRSVVEGSQCSRLIKYCPMCGITTPKTFDHYLPSSRFPEFSVHPVNLVPCCAICNSTKDNHWLDESGQRQFLHLYTDVIPNETFLSVALKGTTSTAMVAATFSINRPRYFRKTAWCLIETHFRRLRLLDRYKSESNTELSEIIDAAAAHLDDGGKSAKGFIRRSADRRAQFFGENNWRVKLMRELADYRKLDALVDTQRA